MVNNKPMLGQLWIVNNLSVIIVFIEVYCLFSINFKMGDLYTMINFNMQISTKDPGNISY